ncbi:hypothetical protein [Bradyrhizobium sp. Arg816]|uniref:hypothetical protein n=1 Tax=Bradyrhizobium sp. Arg816 TaxID=2998491 RepID=UPI00249F8C1B|nr:hypothetical protein [Bradyrhizobium sp. Arg816]MDI3566655.1 hypothetical protein [Bradyrhizobium sp. Arg816]
MADDVRKAVTNLLQFTNRPDRSVVVKYSDLQPLLQDIALAFEDIDKRLKALENS